MEFYPDLSTGAPLQLPLRRGVEQETVWTETAGRVFARQGAAGVRRRWEIRYEALTGGEVDVLQEFFRARRGSWQSFAFLDPADNLLRWSEDLMAGVWQRDAGLTAGRLAANVAVHTLANATGVARGVWQQLNLAGGRQYAAAVELRGSGTGALLLGDRRHEVQAGEQWRRFEVAALPAAESTMAGLEFASGASVEARRWQVRVGLACGTYVPSYGRAGVVHKVRFGEDELRFTATGPDQFTGVVRLEECK